MSSIVEGGNRCRIEPGERRPEGLALAQDGDPCQPGLEALEAELLEQPDVVDNRTPPLVVVVRPVQRVAGGAHGHRGRSSACCSARSTIGQPVLVALEVVGAEGDQHDPLD